MRLIELKHEIENIHFEPEYITWNNIQILSNHKELLSLLEQLKKLGYSDETVTSDVLFIPRTNAENIIKNINKWKKDFLDFYESLLGFPITMEDSKNSLCIQLDDDKHTDLKELIRSIDQIDKLFEMFQKLSGIHCNISFSSFDRGSHWIIVVLEATINNITNELTRAFAIYLISLVFNLVKKTAKYLLSKKQQFIEEGCSEDTTKKALAEITEKQKKELEDTIGKEIEKIIESGDAKLQGINGKTIPEFSNFIKKFASETLAIQTSEGLYFQISTSQKFKELSLGSDGNLIIKLDTQTHHDEKVLDSPPEALEYKEGSSSS